MKVIAKESSWNPYSEWIICEAIKREQANFYHYSLGYLIAFTKKGDRCKIKVSKKELIMIGDEILLGWLAEKDYTQFRWDYSSI